jgi:tetratricopeptide (TPR) repeat protein
LSLLALAATDVSGKKLEDRKWIEVSTEHFRVYSVLSRKKTIEFVRRLDLLRLAVPVITNIRRTDSVIPTHIYVVKNAADFRVLGINRNLVGQFSDNLRNNTIVLRNVRNMDETAIILHEYAHFLMRNHTGSVYPRWYDEGFAEYLSGTRISRDRFQIGHPDPGRLVNLETIKWLSPRKLLDPNEYASLSPIQVSMFYVQAWALVHFLLNRDDRESSFSDDMRRYMELTTDGTDDLAAFESAFGISAIRLWRTVARYLEKKCCNVFNLKIDELQADFEPKIRKIPKAEITLALAQTAAMFRKFDVAKKWYELALQDEVTRPQAEAGLGDLLAVNGDFDAAKSHYETAVALAPDDVLIQLDFAEYWLFRAATALVPDEADMQLEFVNFWLARSTIPQLTSEQEAYLSRARKGFIEVWKLDDSVPEAYAMHGKSFLMEGKNPGKAIELLERAARLYRSSVFIRIPLAEAYAQAGRNDDAIRQAQLILAWGHDDNEVAQFARSIIDQLQGEDGVSRAAADSSNP